MTSRGSFSGPRINNKTENEPAEPKGNKPIREASTISDVFVLMIVHLCKKILFFDSNLKIAIYLGVLFLLSLIADVLTFPRSYFSRSDNILNQYFVKIGWFWTLFLTGPFCWLTAHTISCGDRFMAMRRHLPRLLIATFFWYFWTTMFNIIETKYGRCNTRMFDNKISCLKNGSFWNGFDLSGHCFILIYSSLIMKEETKALIGWERIKDYIIDEQYSRSIDDRSVSTNPLKNLNTKELDTLKNLYDRFTPYVRGLLIAITGLHLLWDVMLVSTIIYYHIMVEKFLSGIIAILTWFVTYRIWYTIPHIYPNLPGEGVFKYNKDKQAPTTAKHKKRTSSSNGKHFMGMPLSTPQDPSVSSNGENTK